MCGVFVYKDQVFTIKRQNYLSVFPGYTAFPGGKVDKEDKAHDFELPNIFNGYDPYLIIALDREMQEEIDKLRAMIMPITDGVIKLTGVKK